MAFPTPHQYTSASGSMLRALQEQIVHEYFGNVESAPTFEDLVVRTEQLMQVMRSAGYQTRLLDEDAESMIVYYVSIDSAHGLTAHATWDANEGACVCCHFVDCGVHLTLAESEHPVGVVEIHRPA